MNHKKEIKNCIIWILIAVMALSMLSVLSACKATEQDMHVPAEIMRNPETPLVYPGESFVPTAEPTYAPTPTPYYASMYSNPYECYYDQLKKLLHGERIGVSDSESYEPYDFDPVDSIYSFLKFENGTLTVRSGEISLGFFDQRPWKDIETQTVFTFPNPDLWYDIFPPGAKLAGISNATEELYDGQAADTEIVIPEYNQDADGNYDVIFGGDWMVVYLSSGRNGWSDSHFSGQEEWARINLSHSAHTWILRTNDNWKTWEHMESLEADALASMVSGEEGVELRVSDSIWGAHVSKNGVMYLCYKKWYYWESMLMQGYPGIPEILVTTDGGKTWTIITDENAADFGWNDPYFYSEYGRIEKTYMIFPSYFEGMHGLMPTTDLVVSSHNYIYRFDRFLESYDGGLTWTIKYLIEDEKDGGWYLSDILPEFEED